MRIPLAIPFAVGLVLASGCMGGTDGSTTSATTLATTTGGQGESIHHFFDFGGEEVGTGDLSGWRLRSDVPIDPNNPGSAVSWSITACDDAGWEDHIHIQAHPVHSACFAIDGRQDDGTIWISRPLAVTAGQAYRANVTVRAWGVDSFNTVADLVLRLGVDAAEGEDDFQTAETSTHGAIRQALDTAEGWTLYQLEWTSGPVQSGILHLDLGISVIWETEMVRYLDALAVELVPV